MLPTAAEEDSCLATGTSNSNSSSEGLAIAGIIFGVLGLCSAAYCAYALKMMQSSAPLASSSSSSMSKNDQL
jgi:hypothetical protein